MRKITAPKAKASEARSYALYALLRSLAMFAHTVLSQGATIMTNHGKVVNFGHTITIQDQHNTL